eukprot:2754612-Prymnesium_polylepis.1
MKTFSAFLTEERRDVESCLLRDPDSRKVMQAMLLSPDAADDCLEPVSYTHLRAHETLMNL